MNTSQAVTTASTSSIANQICRGNVLSIGKSNVKHLTPGLYRVVWANRRSNSSYLMRFPDSSQGRQISTGNSRRKIRLKKPFMVPLDTLENMLSGHLATKVKAIIPKHLRRRLDALTQAEQRILDKGRLIVSHLATDKDMLFALERGMLGKYIVDIVRAFAKHSAYQGQNIGRDYIYQVIYRYWLYGNSTEGLIGNTQNCGAPGCYRNPGERKRGRPTNLVRTGHSPDNKGFNTTQEVREIIWVAWEAYGGEGQGYTKAYREMIRRHFLDWELASTNLWDPKPTDKKIPSIDVFRHYVKRRFGFDELQAQLIPPHILAQTKQAIRGKEFDNLFGPAQRYMIDATVADVWLVSSFNSYWLIGRPIVYFVRDVWSGMIVGLHVALEGPSWDTARVAIYNAFSRKESYLRHYGFNLTDESWPCFHLCTDLIHDRGEVLSIPSFDSAADLRLSLRPCPPGSPQEKGSIETLFRWNNTETLQWLPGAVIARNQEWGRRDTRIDASLTMYSFTRLIISGVLKFNQTSILSNRLVGELGGLDIYPTPINLWRWGLENLNGSPTELDSEALIRGLLPKNTASLHADGVHFAGITYAGGFLEKTRLREYARARGVQTVDCRHDPNRPGLLYTLNQESQLFEELAALPGHRIDATNRLEEVQDKDAYQQLEQNMHREENLLNSISHDQFVAQEIAASKADKSKYLKPASKREHLGKVRENRRIERELASSALNGTSSTATLSSSLPSSPNASPLSANTAIPKDILDLLLEPTGE